MSKYAEDQIKKLLKNNQKSEFALKVKIYGEFAETNWMTITHATAKMLAKLLT